MIIKLDHKINIENLKDYLEFVRKKCPPFMKKNGPWGGWSITSSNGEVYDGWQTGEKIHDELLDANETERIKKLFSNSKFNSPTIIHNNYMQGLLEELTANAPNLELTRIRIAILKPHSEDSAYWHKDGEIIDSKVFRLHIPIITNEQCIFEYEDQKLHLPADGSIYLIDVSRMHRVINLSSEDRYHLIADVRQVNTQ